MPGNDKPNPVKPFVETGVATFDYPWAIAFLPDGHMLVTEKPGKLYLVSQTGAKQQVTGVPRVNYDSSQEGLLDVALSPHFGCRPHGLPDLFGAGSGRLRPGAGARHAGGQHARRAAGDLAATAARPWRAGRRDRHLRSERRISLPDRRRAAALHAGAGPQSGDRQDPAPHARRQARARQSDGGQDRRGHASR